jgi:hypothetical protein
MFGDKPDGAVMTLVRTLYGNSIPDDLSRAYVALATAFLRHRGGGSVASEKTDPCLLDSAVCATEQHIDLRQTRENCDLIATDEERPGEVFNNLGHMFVLLQAIRILDEKCSLTPCLCAPTQQSENEGERIADLKGGGWVLEAFGGSDIKNNAKLAKDLRTLSVRAKQGDRTFLAFRASAWPTSHTWGEAIEQPISHRCAPSHGGPFSAHAHGQVQGRLNGVTVLEVCEITVQLGE